MGFITEDLTVARLIREIDYQNAYPANTIIKCPYSCREVILQENCVPEKCENAMDNHVCKYFSRTKRSL
jgi:hypothetical protein